MFPKYGPNEVFACVSFDTVINFLTLGKEENEYQERFSDIWQKINK